ncbi:MAG: hypothetical protein ACFFCI_02545 [Promethearchaeota archaeon]
MVLNKYNLQRIFFIISIILLSTVLMNPICSLIKSRNNRSLIAYENTLVDYPLISFTQSWEPNGTAICTISSFQNWPTICIDDEGGAIITWVDAAKEEVYAQKINAKGQVLWEPNGTAICTDISNHIVDIDICTDGAGGAIIAWQDLRTAQYDIFIQRINTTGQTMWTPNGTLVTSEIGPHTNPELCSDNAGGAYLAWVNQTGITSQVYAQRFDSDGNFMWDPNGIKASNYPVNYHQSLINDGEGGIILAFEHEIAGESDIYAQKINGTGNIIWSMEGEPICTENANQDAPKVCSDGQGGAIITWSDKRDSEYNVYAQRISAGGSVMWILNGTEISTSNYSAQYPEILGDGLGGAIIVWGDYRGPDVYGQRINENGYPMWIENGTALSSTSMGLGYYKIISDGAHGAIITWEAPSAGDIYAQRVNMRGEVRTKDAALCTIAGYQMWPQLCSGGNGVAIVTWEDERSGTPGIYAQRVVFSPEIIVSSPTPGSFFSAESPDFTVEIYGYNISSTWYSLDGGVINTTFSGQTGVIDQGEWDKLGEGAVPILFYAKNYGSEGDVGYSEVVVFKDTIVPEIFINSPSGYTYYEIAPSFNITINESNLETVWYTIDRGAHNYTITSLTGTINQAAWDAAPTSAVDAGPEIQIRFYGKDLAGNIGFNEIYVKKLNKVIPGYQLIILIGVISLIICITLKKKH